MKKFLLVALTTVREDKEGNEKRVRFPAKTVQDLTKDELKTLDDLEIATGKPHYRDPLNEGGGDDEDGENEEFLGASVAMDKKTADQLRAYLTFNEVEFDASLTKPDLLKAAKAHEADAGL